MSNLRQSALLEESGDVQQLDDKLLDLMKRLGIEAFPPHETLVIPLERIVIPGADLVRPSPLANRANVRRFLRRMGGASARTRGIDLADRRTMAKASGLLHADVVHPTGCATR